MKIEINLDSPLLLVCQQGLDRSACLKRELIEKRHYTNVINVGINSVSPETFQMVGNWAKLIIVIADAGVWDKVPWDLKGKAIFENIGHDIWGSPDNPVLKKICKRVADDLKL